MLLTRELPVSTRLARGNDQSYRAQIVADAPRCYWRFGDASIANGSTAADEMGLLAATYRDPRGGELAKVPGPMGGPAIRVASTTSISSSPACVEVPDHAVTKLQASANWTLEFWARRSSSARTPSFPGIFSKNSATGWLVYFFAANTGLMALKRGAFDTTLVTGSGKTMPVTNEWRHYVITWNSATTQFKSYINGKSLGSLTSAAWVDSADTTVLRFGVDTNTNFPVELAEVAIYDTVAADRLPASHFDAMMGGIPV